MNLRLEFEPEAWESAVMVLHAYVLGGYNIDVYMMEGDTIDVRSCRITNASARDSDGLHVVEVVEWNYELDEPKGEPFLVDPWGDCTDDIPHVTLVVT